MSESDLSELLFSIIAGEKIDTLADLVAERLTKEALPQFLSEREAAQFIGSTPGSLRTMRYEGTGPEFVKLGTGVKAMVRYDRSDLVKWMTARPRYQSTSEFIEEKQCSTVNKRR